jgi:hypothetical protein
MKFLYPGGGVNSCGVITAPNHRGIPAGIKNGNPWAGDLGCLIGPEFVKKINLKQVLEWLPLMRPYSEKCLFMAGGDIVFNAEATLEAYEEFKHYFQGWPLAYVAQNGAEILPIPDDCAAVFIGGDTAWKESTEAVTVIGRALAMGKHVHIGRVNWWRRYQLFKALPGSENFTCDGTRPRYDGRQKTLEAWDQYQTRPAKRQLVLPGAYLW